MIVMEEASMARSADSVVVLIGCAMLALTLLDILVTTLHPSAESPLSPRVYRFTWRAVGWVARRLPGRARQRLLAWLLPGSIAGLLLLWVLLLLVGFALIYVPGMRHAGAFHVERGRLGWPDAFYFSGVCLTSMGFGDIVPEWGWLRAAAVAEGLCSPLVVGVAVAYVLAVYPVLPHARTLAITLNEETDGRVDAVPMVRRYLSVGAAEALAARCRELATSISALSDAHTTHPVLFYAHPKHAEQSFLRVLLVTQHLVALLRYALPRDSNPNLVRDPRVIGLEETLIVALRTMGASLHLHVQPEEPQREMVQDLGHAHGELLERLRAIQLGNGTSPSAALRRGYIRFRLVTDPYIHAYWANSGYNADDVWGDHPPLRGTTAPLPHGDEEEYV
jgi:hypothetical protein